MDKQKENKRAKMESEYDVKDIIVIDNGADTVKIGISGEDKPRIIIDSIGGEPKLGVNDEATNQKPACLFGQQLQQAKLEKKFELEEKFPIQNGKIVDFDAIRDLYVYALDQLLQVNEISSCNLLIIDSPLNPKAYKHKLAEILFDDMKVNSVLFQNSSSLSLFSTGETTGLVVESGHSLTTCIPVFEGFAIPHAFQHSYLAGQKMTEVLKEELKIPAGQLDDSVFKDIKERMCYVARDYYVDVNGPTLLSLEEKSYELPDGSILEINNSQRYKPTEIIFNPSIIGDDSMSIPEMMIDTLHRCDVEFQEELYRNIVLCGGSSLFRGYLPRIEKELLNEVTNTINRKDINFVQNTHRRYSAWIGGSMLGSLSTFQNLAITKNEYEENPESKMSIIHKKTF
ncbi:hypothetical protein ABPG74_020895 [Tetrahymena malaccensis]